MSQENGVNTRHALNRTKIFAMDLKQHFYTGADRVKTVIMYNTHYS